MTKDDSTRTTPAGLSRYAAEFLDAALCVDDHIGTRPGYEIVPPIPVLYLAGHSIELSLKAYLLHRGITLPELRKNYGHNLIKCLNKAEELGLSVVAEIDSQERVALEVLDELYSTKQLEYIVTGDKRCPAFGFIHPLGRRLVESIGQLVGYVHLTTGA